MRGYPASLPRLATPLQEPTGQYRDRAVERNVDADHDKKRSTAD